MKKTNYSNGFYYFLTSTLTQLLNLVIIPLYTRHLSVNEVGQYNLIISIQSLLSIIFTLGIFSGMTRYFNEVEDSLSLKNNALFFSIVWGFFILGISYLTAPLLSHLIFVNDPQGISYILCVVGMTLADCIIVIFINYYSMEFKALKSSIIGVANMVIKLGLTWYFLDILNKNMIGLLQAQLIASLIILIGLIIADIKEIKLRINLIEIRMMLKYGVGLAPGQLSFWILSLIDRFFINQMIDVRTVGIYSMAYKIGMLINPVFIFPFTKVFTPIKYSVYKRSDGLQKIKQFYKIYIAFGWLFILLVSLHAKIALNVLTTSEYLSGYTLVPLIVFSYFLWGLGEFYALGLHIANKSLDHSKIVSIAALTNIGLNFMLIPLFSMWGAAIATIISYATANVLYYVYGKKHLDIDLSLLDPYKPGIVFICLYLVYWWIEPENILTEIILNAALCMIFYFISIKLKALPLEGLRELHVLFKKKLASRKGEI